VTTDRLIKGLPTAPISSPSSSVQRARPRISPIYLAWSAALRACPEVIIEASIEYVDPLIPLSNTIFIYLVPRVGQSRKYIHLEKPSQFLRNHVHLGYWRNLQSSLDFVDQTLESCVNVLHVDIVEIWNLNDGDNVSYLRFPYCFYLCSHGHQYLLSTSFKIKMSHVVKDLAEMPGGVLERCVFLHLKWRKEYEFSIDLTQIDLETSSRNGLMVYIERGG
jgi:hypothetical protein